MGSGSRLAGAAVCVAFLAAGTHVAQAAPHRTHSAPSITPISITEARERPVLRRGDEGPWVRRVNKALSVGSSRTFGRRTASAVRSFRAAHGQRPAAVVTARTWVQLGSLIELPSKPPVAAPPPDVSTRPTLQYGDWSIWVQALQSALGIDADGKFGPATQSAVKAFQLESGLPVTGIVDTATWIALGSRVQVPEVDLTTTAEARTSRSYRARIGAAAFASSWTARMVVQRESGGQCDVASPGGTYRGKWQMDAAFWSSYGGLDFAPRADLATCAQQDEVAFRGWVDRWWQPWPTAIP